MAKQAIQSLRTPCLLLNEQRMDANIAAVKAQARKLNISLRPHGKSPKCKEVVERMWDGGKRQITVSTLREAEYYSRFGWNDILLTTPVALRKLGRIRELQYKGVTFTAVVDGLPTAIALQEASRDCGIRLPVLVELTNDHFRSGVTLGSDDLSRVVEIATKSNSSRLVPFGVTSSSDQPGLPSARRSIAATVVLKRIRRSIPWLRA